MGLPARADFHDPRVQIEAPVGIEGDKGARYGVGGRVFGLPEAGDPLGPRRILLDHNRVPPVPPGQSLHLIQALGEAPDEAFGARNLGGGEAARSVWRF